MKDRLPSKIKVNVIDFSSNEKEAFDYMQSKDHRDDLDTMRVDNTYGYVETPNGIYLICAEGVGNREPISKENYAKFHFSRTFKKEDGARSFEMSPCIGISMDDESLLKLPVKEVVTLDKFIRVYNHRLENNYIQWLDFLNREMQKPKVCNARERVEQEKEEEIIRNSPISELLT